jgi:hypothetical protein
MSLDELIDICRTRNLPLKEERSSRDDLVALVKADEALLMDMNQAKKNTCTFKKLIIYFLKELILIDLNKSTYNIYMSYRSCLLRIN